MPGYVFERAALRPKRAQRGPASRRKSRAQRDTCVRGSLPVKKHLLTIIVVSRTRAAYRRTAIPASTPTALCTSSGPATSNTRTCPPFDPADEPKYELSPNGRLRTVYPPFVSDAVPNQPTQPLLGIPSTVSARG